MEHENWRHYDASEFFNLPEGNSILYLHPKYDHRDKEYFTPLRLLRMIGKGTAIAIKLKTTDNEDPS